ncbi:hypothetical protein DXU77_13065 [Pseudomonas lactis]|nr:hypothetical protein [Pseudomonas lactis]
MSPTAKPSTTSSTPSSGTDGLPAQTHTVQCGSWLACDCALSVDEVLAGPPLSQASQLPHWTAVTPTHKKGRHPHRCRPFCR